MNKLGFTNFRKFPILNPLEYGGITFLVGKNSSGKSSFSKALILCSEFLQSNDLFNFKFSTPILGRSNVLTYSRSLNAQAEQNIITFDWKVGQFEVKLLLTGSKEKASAEVVEFFVKDLENNISFEFYVSTKELRIVANPNKISDERAQEAISLLKVQSEKLREELASFSSKGSREYIQVSSNLQSIDERIDMILKQFKSDSNSTVILEYEFSGDSAESLIKSCVESYKDHHLDTLFEDRDFDSEQEKAISELEREFFQSGGGDIIMWSWYAFEDEIETGKINYISSSLPEQSALLVLRNENNYLARAVHEFTELKISPGETEYLFVNRWLGLFNIGELKVIRSHFNEAFEVEIITDQGTVPVGDLGSGSLRLIEIILRLACVIRNSKGTLRGVKAMQTEWGIGIMKVRHIHSSRPLVVIEEPEINLHPAFQSMLANLFYEVHTEFGIDFIIETHSEYMIRKSQVLVKENQLVSNISDNPFSVIYFDENMSQWNMRYREDGKFIQDFGKGFYDESALLTLNLL